MSYQHFNDDEDSDEVPVFNSDDFEVTNFWFSKFTSLLCLLCIAWVVSMGEFTNAAFFYATFCFLFYSYYGFSRRRSIQFTDGHSLSAVSTKLSELSYVRCFLFDVFSFANVLSYPFFSNNRIFFAKRLFGHNSYAVVRWIYFTEDEALSLPPGMYIVPFRCNTLFTARFYSSCLVVPSMTPVVGAYVPTIRLHLFLLFLYQFGLRMCLCSPPSLLFFFHHLRTFVVFFPLSP
jgi:hypothetical protein